MMEVEKIAEECEIWHEKEKTVKSKEKVKKSVL